MEYVKNCEFCGKPFERRNYNQKYCSEKCKRLANYERVNNRRKINGRDFGTNSQSCIELWKLYRMYKKRVWSEMFVVERLLKEKGCWFKRKFHLTEQDKQVAEQHDKKTHTYTRREFLQQVAKHDREVA